MKKREGAQGLAIWPAAPGSISAVDPAVFGIVVEERLVESGGPGGHDEGHLPVR